MTEAAERERLEGGRPRRRARRRAPTPRPSTPAASMTTDPEPGARCSTAARSPSCCRWARSGTTYPSRGHDRGPGAGRPGRAQPGSSASPPRSAPTRCRRAVVIGSAPKAGTTLRPGSIVDLVVSKGPTPVPVRDWVGKSADDAKTVIERKGLKVDRRPAGLRRRDRRGRRHLQSTRQRHHCSPRRHASRWSSRRDPSWSRCPSAASPRCRGRPPSGCRTPASTSTRTAPLASSASASSSRSRPAVGDDGARAARSPSP